MKSKIIFASFLIAILLFANPASAALVTCGGYNSDGSVDQCSIGDLIGTIKLIINYLLAFAWMVSILFIVISGLRMILARGNEEALSTAKSSLSSAIIGFIIILTSFVILNLVVGLLTGSSGLSDAFGLINTNP